MATVDLAGEIDIALTMYGRTGTGKALSGTMTCASELTGSLNIQHAVGSHLSAAPVVQMAKADTLQMGGF